MLMLPLPGVLGMRVVISTVLRRQHAGEQRHATNEVALQHLTESLHALGQQDAVEPVSDVSVLVADMDAALNVRILGNARRLQQNFVERCVSPSRLVLDGLLGDYVSRRTERWRYVVGNFLIQDLVLPHHVLRRLRRNLFRRGRRGRRCCDLARRCDRPWRRFARGGFLRRRLRGFLGRGHLDLRQLCLSVGPVAGDHARERGTAEQQSGTDGGTHLSLQMPSSDSAYARRHRSMGS
jgi:hypothetical protein